MSPPKPDIRWTSLLILQVDERERCFLLNENAYGCWATEDGSHIVGFGEHAIDAIANYLQQEK